MNKFTITIGIEEANLILMALAERSDKLTAGAMKTQNKFYAEFASKRAGAYAECHNLVLRQLLGENAEWVGDHIEIKDDPSMYLNGGLMPAT